MSTEQQELEAAIRALEAQRALLGNTVVDTLLAAARAKLAVLTQAADPAAGQDDSLKQVTVLFLDVVGFTELSRKLDPESIGELMDDALSRGTEIVQAHGGRVLQYAGDSILAVFGGDESHEDDAERAVQCGLACLALGETLAAGVLTAHGHTGFNVRVGIHTGSVLLGGRIQGEGGIHGVAVNIAARMEQTAPAGGLRISQDTYAQVRGLFDVDVEAPLTVKGVDVPVQSYLVRRGKPRRFRMATRGIEGVETPMVGREAELKVLQDMQMRLLRERRFAAATVVAGAGIGKSRLLYEFAAWGETRPETFMLFRGRATPQTGAQAYGLLRDILAWRFDIADDDNMDVARQKIEAGIVPLFLQDDGPELAQSHAHLLGHLIGIAWTDSHHIRGILDDARQIRDRALHVAAQLFRRMSLRNSSVLEDSVVPAPLVLLIEDLHWADAESLDFLERLPDVNGDVAMLMVCSTRPTLFQRRPGWTFNDGMHRRIDLAPLSPGNSRMLARELLKKLPDIPASLCELLAGSAEGNPFHTEELVLMLIDQGAIQTGSKDGEAWTFDTERLLMTKVPTTLTSVLQTRLDGLPVPERRALQQASVVGLVFWDQALVAIETQAVDQLHALVQRELTLPRPGAQLPGLREYAFRHQILHQVTYDTVLKRHKRAWHAKAAGWIAGLADQDHLRSGDMLGLAAEHFELADDKASAAEFHTRAVERAAQRLAHDRVLHHVGRALALLDELPGAATTAVLLAQADMRWRLLNWRETTLDLLARREEQAADLESLVRLAELLDDDSRRSKVALRMCVNAMLLDDWETMDKTACHAMACAKRAGDDGSRLHALRLLAHARLKLGDFEEGRMLAVEGLAEARRLGLRSAEGKLLNVLAVAAQMRNDVVAMVDLCRETLNIQRETANRISEGIALSNLGVCCLSIGDLTEAGHNLDAAMQLTRANGDRVIQATVLHQLSTLALWQGDAARAMACARQSLTLAATARSPGVAIMAGLRLGQAELAAGRLREAHQTCSEARAAALAGNHRAQHDISAVLALVSLAEGDQRAAQVSMQSLLDPMTSTRALDGAADPRLIEFVCYRVLSLGNDPQALGWLARAHASMMAQADAMEDVALRQGFLHHIPYHVDIATAWAHRHEALVDTRTPR